MSRANRRANLLRTVRENEADRSILQACITPCSDDGWSSVLLPRRTPASRSLQFAVFPFRNLFPTEGHGVPPSHPGTRMSAAPRFEKCAKKGKAKQEGRRAISGGKMPRYSVGSSIKSCSARLRLFHGDEAAGLRDTDKEARRRKAPQSGGQQTNTGPRGCLLLARQQNTQTNGPRGESSREGRRKAGHAAGEHKSAPARRTKRLR